MVELGVFLAVLILVSLPTYAAARNPTRWVGLLIFGIEAAMAVAVFAWAVEDFDSVSQAIRRAKSQCGTPLLGPAIVVAAAACWGLALVVAYMVGVAHRPKAGTPETAV